MHDGFTRSGDRRSTQVSSLAPMAMEDLESRLLLATFTVTSLVDYHIAGQTSLREAVDAANLNPGADIIAFNAALFPVANPNQTLDLLGAEIDITESLTINAPLAANGVLTIDASDASRIFDISGGNVTINRLTLTNARSADGGAIRMAGGGILTVTESTITDSFAGTGRGGGILNLGGTLILSDMTFTGGGAAAGGGIYSRDGNVTLSAVTFTDNTTSTGAGGGLFFQNGILTITGGGFTGNTAFTAGGGLYASAATITMTDSGFDGNQAGTDGGSIYLTGSTLVSNSPMANGTAGRSGGGLYMKGGSVRINSTAISQNAAVNGGGVYQDGGSLTITETLMNANAVVDGRGGAIYATNGTTTTQWGWIDANTSALSVPESLALVGGGAIFATYHSLRLVGTAINDNTSTRFGGAISLDHADATLIQDTLAGNEVTGNDGGDAAETGELSVAVPPAAQNNPSTGWKNLAITATGSLSGTLSGSFLGVGTGIIAGTVRVNGVVTGMVTGLVTVLADGTVTVSGTVTGLGAGESNPLASVDATVTGSVTGSITGNLAGGGTTTSPTDGFGGGVYAGIGSSVDMSNCTVTDNTSIRGGGIYVNQGAEVTIRSSIISGNVADATGVGPDIFGPVSASGNLLFAARIDEVGAIISGSNLKFLDPMLDVRDGFVGCYDLLPGSPAINAGSNAGGQTTDERGWPRLFGAKVDIGSVEHQANIGARMDLGIDGRHNVTSYSFGFVPVGTTKTVHFILTNTGTGPLNYAAAIQTADPTVFSVIPPNENLNDADDPPTLLPGRSMEIVIAVTPTSTAPAEDLIVIVTDDDTHTSHLLTVTVNEDKPLAGARIGDVSVTEGKSGTKMANFTVTLSGPSDATVTVDYDAVNGTALAGSDFTATSGVLVFAPGQTTRTISVPIRGDAANEADETFRVVLSNPVGALLDDAQGTGTIVNDDPLPAVRVSDVRLAEGNAGTKNFTFTVTLSAASGRTVNVGYATADGTAVGGIDYQAAAGTLTFAPGQVTQTLSILVNGDTTNEAAETFFLNLSGADLATIADAQGLATILNDDGLPGLSIDDVTVVEGTGGTTDAIFTVTLSAVSGQTVTVKYATSNGTALAGSDYGAVSGTLVFVPGQVTQQVVIGVVGDGIDEDNQTFRVTLSKPVNAAITDAQGIGTITDDDAAPTLAVGDVSILEGNSGTRNAVFTVALSEISERTITVNYATADGTAQAGTDYTSRSGTLTIAPGQASRTVTVAIKGDKSFELDETFALNLSAPVNATIADSQAIATILNDDTPPAITIGDASLTEGDAGSLNLTFTVSLSIVNGLAVTVDYATADLAAVAGLDYTAASGTVTFAPGQVTRTIVVAVLGDTLDEADETFAVNLSNPANAAISDAQAIGTIRDNDAAPSLSIDDVTAGEGAGTATFTVTLSQVSGKTVTVAYATANGAAVAGADYTAAAGTLTFAPGVTTQTIDVPVLDDVLDESTETYFVNLTAPVNATLADNQGLGRITDNDPLPTFSISDASVAEGNTGTKDMVFTVTLSAASGREVLVNYSTANGTATAGSDFVAKFGTLTFAPGVTSQTVIVKVKGDTTVEGDETLLVNLSGVTNATILDGQGLGTIINDD